VETLLRLRWWPFAVRALVAVLFGIAILAWQDRSLVAQALTAGQLRRYAEGWQATAFAAAISYATSLALIPAPGAKVTVRMTVVASAALIEAAVLAANVVPLARWERVVPTSQLVQVRESDLHPGRSTWR
jgi:hypothetical protein